MFGHNFFKKQPFWPFFIRILAISYVKYLATLLCRQRVGKSVATAVFFHEIWGFSVLSGVLGFLLKIWSFLTLVKI